MRPDLSYAEPLTIPLPMSVIPGVNGLGRGAEREIVEVARVRTASATTSTRSIGNDPFKEICLKKLETGS